MLKSPSSLSPAQHLTDIPNSTQHQLSPVQNGPHLHQEPPYPQSSSSHLIETSSFKLLRSFTLESFWTFLFLIFHLSAKNLTLLSRCIQTPLLTTRTAGALVVASSFVWFIAVASSFVSQLPPLEPLHPIPSVAAKMILLKSISENPKLCNVSSSHSSSPWGGQWSPTSSDLW